jgi:hypothetical protein
MRSPKTLQSKSKTHQVIPLDRNTFNVKSGASGNSYLVRLYIDIPGGMCDCKWGEYRRYADFYRSGCSHVQAVYRHLEGLAGRNISTWSDMTEVAKQHRSWVNIGDDILLTTRKVSL